MKKELEEAKQYLDINTCIYWDIEIGCEKEKCICENQKPKQERMYSEEEVYNILVQHTIELFKGQPCTLDEFFEQFKKEDKQ